MSGEAEKPFYSPPVDKSQTSPNPRPVCLEDVEQGRSLELALHALSHRVHTAVCRLVEGGVLGSDVRNGHSLDLLGGLGRAAEAAR